VARQFSTGTKFGSEKGKVIAVDICKKRLDLIRKKSGKKKKNLDLVWSYNLKEVKGKADFILLITVLHEMEDPERFFKCIFGKLKPHGKIILIEWQKKKTEFGSKFSDRIAKSQILKWAKGKKKKEFPLNDNFYFFEFSNPNPKQNA